MYVANELLRCGGKSGDTLTFTVRTGRADFRLIGSSMPRLLEQEKKYSYFSISLPPEKEEALFFFSVRFMGTGVTSTSFFRIAPYENEKVYAHVKTLPTFSSDVAVDGETITIKTSDGNVVSTDDKPGAYKVTHDAMCQFLIGDIDEEELLASATELAEEESELERLRDLISHYEEMERASSMDLSAIKTQLDDLCKIKDSYGEKLLEVRQISMKPWWSIFTRGSRLSRIRKML